MGDPPLSLVLWNLCPYIARDGSRSQMSLMCTVDKENRKAVTGRPISHEGGIHGEEHRDWQPVQSAGQEDYGSGVCMHVSVFIREYEYCFIACVYIHACSYVCAVHFRMCCIFLYTYLHLDIFLYIWVYVYWVYIYIYCLCGGEVLVCDTYICVCLSIFV